MDGLEPDGVDDYEAMLATRFERIGKALMIGGGLAIVGSGTAIALLDFPRWAIVGVAVGLAAFVEGGRRWQLGRPPTSDDPHPIKIRAFDPIRDQIDPD